MIRRILVSLFSFPLLVGDFFFFPSPSKSRYRIRVSRSPSSPGKPSSPFPLASCPAGSGRFFLQGRGCVLRYHGCFSFLRSTFFCTAFRWRLSECFGQDFRDGPGPSSVIGPLFLIFAARYKCLPLFFPPRTSRALHGVRADVVFSLGDKPGL